MLNVSEIQQQATNQQTAVQLIPRLKVNVKRHLSFVCLLANVTTSWDVDSFGLGMI
jgi:hypothetical protein